MSDCNARVSVDQAIDALNRMYRRDPDALHALCETRVPCIAALEDDEACQVAGPDGGPPVVGMLGILNGIFGCDAKGRGFIAGEYSDDSGRLLGFVRSKYSEPPSEKEKP